MNVEEQTTEAPSVSDLSKNIPSVMSVVDREDEVEGILTDAMMSLERVTDKQRLDPVKSDGVMDRVLIDGAVKTVQPALDNVLKR